MKLSNIVKWSYTFSLVTIIIGAWQKITHVEGAEKLLIVGVICGLIFIISVITEVRGSAKISVNEKTMWTVAFILMSGFTGLIYFLGNNRRRIIENS